MMPCDMEAYEREIMAMRMERLPDIMNLYYEDCLTKIMQAMQVPAKEFGSGGAYANLYMVVEQFKQILGVKE